MGRLTFDYKKTKAIYGYKSDLNWLKLSWISGGCSSGWFWLVLVGLDSLRTSEQCVFRVSVVSHYL